MTYKLPELDYKVLSTGSIGNAVRIEDIMIDCGISYKRMKSELNKCRVLFITHKHYDHLKTRTLEQIRKYHKNIKIGGNYEIAQLTKVDMITGERAITGKDWKIKPFYVPHNVVCQGIKIKFNNGTDVIYCTDSRGTKNWIQGQYDYLFIESNYDENKLKMIDEKDYKYDVINSSMRHTSYQESKAFYYMNRKGIDSKWIELHKSKRFY